MSRKLGMAALLALGVMVSSSAYAQDPVGTGTLSRASGWVAAGTALDVTATAEAETSNFGGWSGQTEGTSVEGSTISFTVNGPRSLTATFVINQYGVEFVLGGLATRSGGGALEQLVKHGMGAAEPVIDVTPGYAFANWDKDFDAVTGALTVNALYTTNSYTLTFVSAGSAVDDITQPFGSTITPPANPTREGYAFDGWDPAIPATMPFDGGTHTAQWTQNMYAFTVNSAHGEPDPGIGSANYAHGSTVTFSMPVSTIENGTTQYVASGWVSTGSLESSATGTGGSFTITEPTEMTWQWTTNYWVELNVVVE